MVLAVAALLLQIGPVTAPPVPVLTKGSVIAANVVSSKAPLNLPARPTETNEPVKLVAIAESGAPRSGVPAEPGQDTQSLSNIRIPPLKPEKRWNVSMAERPGSQRRWLALSLAQSGAAAFDAYTTRQAIAKGAVEKDPMMRPFAHSPAIYGAIQLGPIVLDYFARRMQRSSNGVERRLWWVPQSIGTATYIFSGVHNMGVAGR